MSDSPDSRAGVLCAGTILVDVGKVIDAYPALDHLATIEQVSVSTGGPGLNMAVDLRMLGATFPVGVLGAVGEDQHAAFILAECARLGIDVAGVRTLAGAVTSFTDGMIERDGGRRTFFHHSGANALFDASTADLATPRARILHAGAPGIHPVMDRPRPGGGNGWSALLRRAQAAGLHTNLEMVSLEPHRIAEVGLPCLPYLDSIVINELEAGALTGIDAAVPTADGAVDWPALEAMALAMIELGVSVLAVVHFPAGCVAAAPGGRTWRQGSVALPREQVRSTTGAGDAFAAGVILGLHEGWPVERCLRLGVASAAACVRSPNTSDGIRPAEACLAEAGRAGYRPTPGLSGLVRGSGGQPPLERSDDGEPLPSRHIAPQSRVAPAGRGYLQYQTPTSRVGCGIVGRGQNRGRRERTGWAKCLRSAHRRDDDRDPARAARGFRAGAGHARRDVPEEPVSALLQHEPDRGRGGGTPGMPPARTGPWRAAGGPGGPGGRVRQLRGGGRRFRIGGNRHGGSR